MDPRIAAKRDDLIAALQAADIGAAAYFPPVHLQPVYRTAFGHRPGDFPCAEQLSARTLALPFFSRMSPDQVDVVCQALERLVASA
jgi:perosamine synthetase